MTDSRTHSGRPPAGVEHSGPALRTSCGFRVFDALGDEPQLLYALPEQHTGKGFATEVARALVEYARRAAGFAEVSAAVDQPNRASIRVLEKVGFRRGGEAPGAFGRTLLFTWRWAGGTGDP